MEAFFHRQFQLNCGSENDTFIGEFQHCLRSGNVFGGMIVALAAKAALMTIEDRKNYLINSVHCYYVRAGKKGQVSYHVSRVKDGQTVCFRNVIGTQDNKPIITCLVSFKSIDNNQTSDLLHNKYPMPLTGQDLDESVPSSQLSCQYNDLGAIAPENFLVDSRFHNPPSFWFKRSKGNKNKDHQQLEPRQILWMKPWSPLHSMDQNDHRLVILYASDCGLAGPIFIKYWSRFVETYVSLDHSIYFHTDQVYSNQWLLYDTECDWSGPDGTTRNTLRVYSHISGDLVASATQQTYIKMKPKL